MEAIAVNIYLFNLIFILKKIDNSIQNNISLNSVSLMSNPSNALDNKDLYAVISLHKYLTDALSCNKIEHLTIKNLKKILTNIDVNLI